MTKAIMNTANCVLTSLGHYVNVRNPDPRTLDIFDIAHALSQINRFGGHTSVPYSVAQHSVAVSRLVSYQYRMYALLHDAAEAYLGDITSPVKYLGLPGMEQIRDLESYMQAMIYRRFGLGIATEACLNEIRIADLVVLATERRDLMPSDSTPWAVLQDVSPLAARIRPMAASAAEAQFLGRFKELGGMR